MYQRNDSGFTLLELLIVIIIVGILSAIAIPAWLIQVNKAKETESKLYVGTMNRTQQAVYTEKRSFTSDIAQLGIGLKTDSTNFQYFIDNLTSSSVVNYSVPKNTLTLRANTGGVQIALNKSIQQTTLSVLCQTVKPSSGNKTDIQFNDPLTWIGPKCTGSLVNMVE